MTQVAKNDVNQIFANDAPASDKPPSFNNYTQGWNESRTNNGKPTIKQMNFLQQRNDNNVLWIHQNGGALPYDASIEYVDGAVVLKDGKLQQLKSGVWSLYSASDADITTWSGQTQDKENKSFVTTVNRLQDLDALSTSENRTVYVKDIGVYRYNATYSIWVRDLITEKQVITVDSFAELANLDTWNGRVVKTLAYYKDKNYGGAEYIFKNNSWIIMPQNRTISIEQFGAVSGAIPAYNFNTYPVETTDNTNAVKSAFEYAKANDLKLIAEKAQCFFFENMADLQLYGNIEIDFNYALFFFSTQLKSNPKTSINLSISGATKTIANLNIATNSYMSKGIELNRNLDDNQGLTLKNVRAVTCRWGIFVDQSECINRIRVVNCDFSSNYYSGIYVNSYTNMWGHSAPVFFRDTICNANGPQDWIINSDAKHVFRDGTTISVRDSEKDVGQQVFLRGLSGAHWLGGQISCHGGARNTSLITLQNVNMFTIDAPDIEDLTAYAQDGTKLTLENHLSYRKDTSGAAIVADACISISVRAPNLYSINAPAILKLLNNPASYDYQVASPVSGFAYTVWDESNPANGIGASDIHPYAIANSNSVNAIAFANTANKEAVSSIIHHEQSENDGTINWDNLNKLWKNGAYRSDQGYALKYLSNHDQALTTDHLYNEMLFPTQVASSSPSSNVVWVFAELPHSTPADGRFILQAIDSDNNILNSAWYAPDEETHYPISNWVRFKVPSGTAKIRYGFVNSQDYFGFIISNYWTNARYSRWHLTVYAVHDGNGAFRDKLRANYSACV